jgi:hypothetical protein
LTALGFLACYVGAVAVLVALALALGFVPEMRGE